MFQLRSVRKIIFLYCSSTFRSRVNTSFGILYGKQQLCLKILSDGCYARYQGVVVVVTPGTKVWWFLLHHVPRCGGCCYTMYQGVVVVVTPCTKVWWLLLHHVPRCDDSLLHHVPRCGGCCYTMYQGVVIVVTPCTKV